MEMNQIKLSLRAVLSVPLYSYIKDFSFIVNGEEFKTSKIISDLISSKISQIHLIDPTFDTFVINTQMKGDFTLFLDLAKFETYSIQEEDIGFISEVIKILDNKYIRCSFLKSPEEITKDNILTLLKIHEKNSTFYSDILSYEIDFASSNFSKILQSNKKELLELSSYTIERIINNRKLSINDEDQLISFINELCKKDCDKFSFLYEYVIFSNVTNSKMTEFLQFFDVDNINKGIWRTLSYRLEKIADVLDNDDDRYVQNSQKEENEFSKGKTFEYENNSKFNGIFNYLKNKSDNNVEKEVEITSSSEQNFHFGAKKAILLPDQDDFFASKCAKDSWICFDFKNHRVLPTCYTIGSTINSFRIRSWVIEGSVDNEKWDIIDTQKDCSQMNNHNIVQAFMIKQDDLKQFKYIRLRMNGPNWSNNDYLRINSFELYGTYY